MNTSTPEDISSKHLSYMGMSLLPIINNSDQKLYKSQSNCKICSQSVKDGAFTKSKKYICKFCYFAVCSSCSNLRCFHSELHEEKRICISCFNQSVRSSLKEKTKQIIPKMIKSAIEQSKLNIIEVNSLEDELDLLKELSFRKREELIQISKEVYQFKEETYEFGNFESTQEIDDRKIQLKEVVEENQGLDLLCMEKQEIIQVLEDQVKINGEKIKEAEAVNKKKGITLNRNRYLENIRDQIYYNFGIFNTLKNNIKNLEVHPKKSDEGCTCF